MTTEKILTVAILAGGESKRFGSRKEHALWRGESMLDVAIRLGMSISSHLILIGRSETERNPSMPFQSYCDIYPDNGPLGGIHAALHYAQTPYVLTMPCDMPLLRIEVFQLLIQNMQADQPVVAVSDSGLEPLLCLWPKSCEHFLMEELRSGRNGPIPVLQTLRALHIPVHELLAGYKPEIFMNINTRDQLDEYTQ